MKERIKRFIAACWDRYSIKSVIGVLILLFFVAYLWRSIFYTIDSGQAGVRWSRFFGGTVLDKVYSEGMHAIFPWDKMYIYNIRVQEIHDALTVLTKNGLSIDLEWSGRFYLRENQLPYLHKYLGQNYIDIVVKPEYLSGLRTVLGNYTDAEIYSRDEEEFLQEISNRLGTKMTSSKFLSNEPIVFHEILLTQLRLPPDIQRAIQDKLIQQHILLSYEFRIQTEGQEKTRKIIEAEGIQQFEATSGISILKWRGIQATEKLAESANSKIIVIGTSSDGLPIILNTDK